MYSRGGAAVSRRVAGIFNGDRQWINCPVAHGLGIKIRNRKGPLTGITFQIPRSGFFLEGGGGAAPSADATGSVERFVLTRSKNE